MNGCTKRWLLAAVIGLLASAPGFASAQWAGLVDESTALGTDRFAFFGSNPEAGGNENYYDGDLGDFDGDGLPDRLLGARYGLLFNTGGGFMVPVRRSVGHLLRGDPGAGGWGEDAMALIDVDNDGDLDALSGGNGEPLSCQINNQWRWRVAWSERGHSALNIVATDLEGDGDADLLVAHSFCIERSCGGPVDFSVLVNDGTGTYVDETAARGLALASGQQIVGVVSGDLDNDGDFDIITQRGDTTTRGIQVAINDGNGMFTTTFTPFPVGCSGFGQNMALGDIDDDGDLDIVAGRCISEGTPNPVAGPYPGGHPTIAHVIGLNDGSGTFTDASATMFDANGYVGELAGSNASLADIDHDGDLDFLAVRSASTFLMLTDHHLQIFLNDGTGRLVYSDTHSVTFAGRGSALGADVDVSDLDGDGDLDVWAGFGSDVVHLFMNQHTDPMGLPADQPRDLRVISADTGGVTLGWNPPPLASNARRYHVYRSLADRVDGNDRELIHVVGRSRHLDQDFFGHLDRHTTTAMLGDPDVTIDPSGEVQFTDTTAVPGVAYFYTVTHVGLEHDESAHTPEVPTMIPASMGADTTGPQISIVSPTTSTWGRFPRIVVTYGDEGSGVNRDSVRVRFDTGFGSFAANDDVSALAYRHDADAFIAYLAPPNQLPADTVVTMTAEVSDMAGNTSTDTVQFFVNTLPSILTSPQLPSASFSASPTGGMAPIDIAFDASASSDPDGLIMRWEWYFGDGETAIGRRVSHRFEFGGATDVVLLVRDAEGNVGVTTQTLMLDGMPPTDAGPIDLDAGVADGGSSCVPDCDRASCGMDGCGGVCGTCEADQTCSDQRQCLCADGMVGCGSVCGIDLDTDPNNCGRCGQICGADQTCESGTCTGGETMEDGCGCRAAGGSSNRAPLAWLALGLLGLLLRRRTRRG